jgi:hypothetical protein
MTEMRIEFYERVSDLTTEEIRQAEKYGMDLREPNFIYRRAYYRLRDIAAPKEIPGIDEYCIIEFNDGTTTEVQGSYDELCILLDLRACEDEDTSY